jgi:CRISPR-associated protein Cas2
MVLVLAYDVVGDGRRQRLHDRLKGFLRPVQKSVFEGHLPESRWDELLALVHAEVDHAEDSVRVYVLCGACAGATVHVGVSAVVPGPDEPVIV